MYYLIHPGRSAFDVEEFWVAETKVFEERHKQLEQQWLSKSWTQCRHFYVAKLPYWNFPSKLIVDLGDGILTEIFDISAGSWVVSHAVKQAIEKIDPDIHQFFPVIIEDKNGQKLGSQPYYTLSIRRKYLIPRQDASLSCPDSDLFIYSGGVKDAIATIDLNFSLRKLVEATPLWQLKGTEINVFFNEQLYQEIRKVAPSALPEFYRGREEYKKGLILLPMEPADYSRFGPQFIGYV